MHGLTKTTNFSRKHGSLDSRLAGIASSLFMNRPITLADGSDARAHRDARSIVGGADLPLFAAAAARDEGAETARTQLPAMPLSEEVVADYQTTRLSLKAHPMSFLRASLAERGFVRASDLRSRKFRSMVHVAGVVLIRQRPGSASGVVFVTLEDESDCSNVIIWPKLVERQRREVLEARLLGVRGRVQREGEVLHLIATRLEDHSELLGSLLTRSRDFH
ncbi:MAG: hypothetical protein IH835_00785 [Proteobacteria bacterium]|nr:hypothetical protein [Pseudomonadota bacterium]